MKVFLHLVDKVHLGIFFISLWFCISIASAQTDSTNAIQDTIDVSTDIDSSRANTFVIDSTTSVNDTTATTDSLNLKSKRDIETTIKYSAADSIRMDVTKQTVYLYGKAKIVYGEITLEADKIEIDWKANTLTAFGGEDSTGKTIGIPNFKQGQENYTSEVIKYNFKTKKGLISKLITQQGEGYIHGQTVKRKEEKLFIQNAQYTTCNLAHPHFYISCRKLKLIPEDKIISGPFNLVVGDVPTPFGFVLGMFPVPKKQKSGLIFPTYGQNRDLGYFLTRGGWYFAISDYIGVKITGDVYTRGTKAGYFETGYRKRYAYNGTLGFNLFNRKDKLDETQKALTYYSFVWTHMTNPAGRTGSLLASVNISSPAYYRQSSYNAATRLAQDFNSSVTYRKTFANTPFSLNISGNHSQNVSTKYMNVTLPNVVFTMNRIFPFRQKGSLGKNWYEQISISYNLETRMSFDNSYQRYNPALNNYYRIDSGLSIKSLKTFNHLLEGGNYFSYGDTLLGDTSDSKINRNLVRSIRLNGAQYGAKQTVPIQTSIKLFKKFSLNPSIVLTEYWYPRKETFQLTRTRDGEADSLAPSTDKGFARAWGWSTGGTNLRTNIYGTVLFKKGKLMGLRHILTPSVGYTYNPDLTKSLYGSFQQIKDENENILYRNNRPYRQTYYGKYSNLFGYPNSMEASILSFSLNNVFEAKVRNLKDTVDPIKRFKILDNLSLAGSYNFMADSFNLSTIQLSAKTNIKDGKIDIFFSSTFDPYVWEESTHPLSRKDRYGNALMNRKNKLLFDESGKLASLLNANLSVSTNLNPKAKKTQSKETADSLSRARNDQYNYIKANADQYVDFTIPWNFYLTYYLTFQGRNFHYGRKTPVTMSSFNLSGDLSITEKWKLTFNTSLDLVAKTIPTATLGIMRDLHCWQMAISIMNFNGNYTYSFNINAKSTLLQDLKLNKRSPQLINSISF